MGWLSSGGSAPPAPNYAALAQQTANSQNQQLDQQTAANRPNQYTPWGSSTWERSNQFDQTGYDTALADWNKAQQGGGTQSIDWNRYASDNPDISGSGMTPQQHYERYGQNEGRQVRYTQNGVSQPNRSDFTSEQWRQNVTLDPAEQRQLEQERRVNAGLGNTAEGLLGQARNSLSTPLNTNGLPAWMNYDTSKLQDVDPNAVRNGVGTDTRNVQAGNLQNITADGLRSWGSVPQGGNFNMSASGNSKAIQDATYNLLSPQRQRERDSEVQRLKNQGLTEDSPAFQRAMQRVDEGDTQAQLQALLAGTTEYGNTFERARGQNAQNFGQRVTTSNMSDAQRQAQLDERGAVAGFNNNNQNTRFDQSLQNAQLNNQSNNNRFGQNLQQQNLAAMLRGQQFGEQGAQAALNNTQRGAMLNERQAIRQSPLNDLRSLMGGQVSNPTFTNFMGAGQGQGTDFMGAGQNGYQAQMNNYNAQQAQQSNMMSGLFGLGGAALGGPLGNKAGSFIGGLLG